MGNTLSFGKSKGGAAGSKIQYMELERGDNTFRIIGGLLPYYKYWIKSPTGQSIPMECLQFNRMEEEFDNSAEDPVKELGLKDPFDPSKDLTCKWAYMVQVINRKTKQVEVLELKKDIFTGIQSVAEQLEADPADLENGFEVVVKKAKTGPKVYNVEYSVRELMCKQKPVTDEDRALIAKAKDISELFPRKTPAEQRADLVRIMTPRNEDSDPDPDVDPKLGIDDID